MSALSRFGPAMARSIMACQHRQMASASVAADPIQKMFVDKIREAKTSSKSLDAGHEKQLREEMLRLKRVYSVDDENKLTQFDYKFSTECDVSLRDIDTSKVIRDQINSGEYQKQLATQSAVKSELIATTPDQTQHDLCLPPLNKPDPEYLIANDGVPPPPDTPNIVPDYEGNLEPLTPSKLERQLNVHFAEDMPTIQDDGPQRDKVNFPRLAMLEHQPPTRFHFIPESWFQFFYPKTGVTGPYVFAAAFGSFLMSKEWLVMEHELLTAFSSVCIFAYMIPKYGPAIKSYFVKNLDADIAGWDKWQKGHIEFLKNFINHYKGNSDIAKGIDELYAARKQDVELQLEAEYRARLKKIHDDTKRRLNYLVAVADSQRQIHHSNLVNAVISGVLASFGPKQEAEVLDDCIVNLRSLSGKHKNAI